MNYPEAAIRRMLFYLLAVAVLIGVTQLSVLSNPLGVGWFGIPVRAGTPSPWTLNFAIVGILLLLLVATLVVMLRARRLERAEARIWLTPGLDRQVFEHAPVGMLLSSAEGRVRAVNGAYSRITGFTAVELLGREETFQQAGSIDGSASEEMLARLHSVGFWDGELWIRRPSGEALGLKASRIAMLDGERRLQGYLTLCSETSTGNEAQQLMLWQAHHDILTKLPNSNLFQERLSRFLVTQGAQQLDGDDAQNAVDGAVLSIGLDGFTNVNDSMGFASGDQVLMEAGHRIALTVRETDTVARLGGDQFAVLLTGVTDDAEITSIASRLVESLGEAFYVRGRELFVTASVGVLGLPAQAPDAESATPARGAGEVMQRVDSARAQAKSAGGNRAEFFEPAMNERAQARYELELALRYALPEQQLELHLQPLVDQRAGHVVSFEALIRWNHPERGMVSPADFIPLAEETGLIVDIGLWIVREAHEQLRRFSALGAGDVRLSINISTRQLRDVGDVNKLVEALRQPETNRLTLEITESLLVANKDLYRDFLSQARGLGAKIALDDFGTGYSSLSYLRDYRFDVLKIDRSFVSGLHKPLPTDSERERADRNLVASIVSLGQILQLEVVAEGVETETELAALGELGCAVVQGYYFSAPMRSSAAHEYLQRSLESGELRQ